MTTREEALACCLALKNAVSDQPFSRSRLDCGEEKGEPENFRPDF